jgi:uncharacterized protein YprB with RNaseH-like and TPR domain
MRILSWDIEASGLNADFGIVLCVGFKTVGQGKAEVLSILDYSNGDLIKAEKKLLKDVTLRLLDSDVWLTHYGTWFDINFVNTRLLYHRLPIIPPNHSHIDTWKISRNRLKLRSNRLKTISEFLKTADEKNAIRPEQWIRAMAGHRASMNYIVEHCRRDVLVLEEVYHLIRPLVLDHPNKGLLDGRGGCSVCGATKLQARGVRVTRTRKYQRFQCQECGGWSSGTKPIAIAPRG